MESRIQHNAVVLCIVVRMSSGSTVYKEKKKNRLLSHHVRGSCLQTASSGRAQGPGTTNGGERRGAGERPFRGAPAHSLSCLETLLACFRFSSVASVGINLSSNKGTCATFHHKARQFLQAWLLALDRDGTVRGQKEPPLLCLWMERPAECGPPR